MSFSCLLILVVLLPSSFGDWAYSQVDDVVMGYNNINSEDAITYRNVLESLSEKPRTFNDSLCREQFHSVFEGLKNKEKWALKVIDSWGHLPPTGLFWGRLVDLGLFDECILTAHVLNGEDNVFVGQYCLASYPLELIIPGLFERQNNSYFDQPRKKSFIVKAVCVPDTCSVSILHEIFKESFLNSSDKSIDTPIFNEQLCTRNEHVKLGSGGIAALGTLMVIFLLIGLSTSYDIMASYRKRKKNPLLITFSLVTNSQKLFKTEDRTQSSGSMECLNAIRFISIMWVVLGHSFVTLPTFPLFNYIRVWEFLSFVYPMLVVNSSYPVDTFLVMSGFLLTFHMLKELDKRGSLSIGNVLWMYIHRYIRLLPLLAVTLVFAITLHRHIGSGPLWKSTIENVGTKCEEYWWASLLYVQNYVNPFELCLTHTWYLSVDSQLYFFAPLIVIPLHKWRRKVVIFILFLIGASTSYIFTVAYVNEVSIRTLETLANALDESKPTLYYSLQARCPPYLVGMLLGYLLHSYKDKRRRLPKMVVLTGWLLCFTLLLGVIFAPYQAQQPEFIEDPVANAFYICSCRLLWAIAIAWIIYACHQGYASYINSFLSYPLWQFLGKLTYAIYLIHPLIQLSLIGNTRINMFHSPMGAVRTFWGDFGIITTVAIVVVLVFESPVIALEKVLLGGGGRKESNNGGAKQNLPPQSIESEDTRKVGTRSG